MSLNQTIAEIVRNILVTDLRDLITEEIQKVFRSELRMAIDEIFAEALSERPGEKTSTNTGLARHVKSQEIPVPSKKSVHTGKSTRSYSSRAASRYGIQVGQRWKAKSYKTNIVGRTIRIVELLRNVVVPEVLSCADGKDRRAAKPISYDVLRQSYDLME